MVRKRYRAFSVADNGWIIRLRYGVLQMNLIAAHHVGGRMVERKAARTSHLGTWHSARSVNQENLLFTSGTTPAFVGFHIVSP